MVAASRYEALPALLTDAELSFLAVLDEAVGGGHGLAGLRVMCKVNLADLIEPQSGLDQRQRRVLRNKVDRKHADFVLVSERSMKPRLVIELDDASHRSAEAEKRDLVKNNAFRSAGLPLLRVPVKRAYDAADLAARIGEKIQAGL